MFVILYFKASRDGLYVRVKSFHESLDQAKEKLGKYKNELTESCNGKYWHSEKYRIMTKKDWIDMESHDDEEFYLDDELEVNNEHTVTPEY